MSWPDANSIEWLSDPDALREARRAAGLTQEAAGALVHASRRTWQDWEGGQRNMPAATRELFLIKIMRGPE